MGFRLSHLLLLPVGFASAVLGQNTSIHHSFSHDNVSLADYYVGDVFVAPGYLDGFSSHLNDLEIEYLEFFTQLRPVKEAPVVVSSCLTPGSAKSKRGPFGSSIRKLRGFLKHAQKKLIGHPPTKPVFQKFCAATSLIINVYYHVVASSDSNFKFVTEAMIRDQTAYMNRYYNHLDIIFVMQDLVYRIDEDFATSKYNPKHPHRRFSRSGTYADLNVWITEDIPGDQPGETTLGYATFPDATLNADQRSYDGVVMIHSTLPQGPEGDGSTLTHEAGHWLGLRHIFDENQADAEQCVAKPDTDFVQDTLQFPAHRPEVFQNEQIPCGGTKAIAQYNFMSYSSIPGQDGFGFTTGQKARIFSRYLGVRRGIKNQVGCITEPIHYKRSVDDDMPLPDNIIDLIREDDKTCAQDLADARARPDVSLNPSPDQQYPEYPEMPIEPANREPMPAYNPLAPPTPGTSLYIERCISERLPFLATDQQTGECSKDGKCTCPPSNVPPKVKTPVDDGSGCPAVCNPHANACHVHSAQNCVFPAPLASKTPRSYCACRPGFKSQFGGDKTKNWRVATKGIENFVWVAEGVECDVQCESVGCGEVPVLEKPCV